MSGRKRPPPPEAAAPLEGAAAAAAADHYATLGVPRAADDGAVRAAYRRRALGAHPDKGGSDAEFHAVSAAFKVLSDPAARAAYDEGLAAPRRGPPPGGLPSVLAQPQPQRHRARPPAERRDAALACLQRLVAAEPRERRQELLRGLPAHVSHALLSWMHSQKPVASAAADGGGRTAAGSQEQQRQPLGPAPSPSASSRGGGSGSDSEAASGPALGAAGAGAAAAAEEPARKRARADGGGAVGVHKVGSKASLYQASIFCLNMSIDSAATTLEQAISNHSTLALIKAKFQEVLAARRDLAGPPDLDAVAERMLDAIEFSCRATGASERDLGLSYRPVVTALAEVGRQINGQRFPDIRRALEQREMLLTAKEAGWPALREAWVEVLCRGGRSQQEAEAFADAAWQAHAPRRAAAFARRGRWAGAAGGAAETEAERRGRVFQEAVQAVDRALEAECRAAARAVRSRLAQEQRDAAREARQHRLSRKEACKRRTDVTMDDLLGAAPAAGAHRPPADG